MCIGLVYAIYTKYIYIYICISIYRTSICIYIYIHIHTCLYKCIAFSPVKELPMTLPGDLLAHPVDEHMYIYIYTVQKVQYDLGSSNMPGLSTASRDSSMMVFFA